LIGIITEAHHHEHFGTENVLVVVDRLLAPAAEEQVRLDPWDRQLPNEWLEAAPEHPFAVERRTFHIVHAVHARVLDDLRIHLVPMLARAIGDERHDDEFVVLEIDALWK